MKEQDHGTIKNSECSHSFATTREIEKRCRLCGKVFIWLPIGINNSSWIDERLLRDGK